MDIKPEVIGAVVGGAILAIASGLGIIQRRGGKTKKGDTDEMQRVGTVIDIVSDLQEDVRTLKQKLQESKDDCARRIDEIVVKYDQQLSEMARQNAELKARLDTGSIPGAGDNEGGE